MANPSGGFRGGGRPRKGSKGPGGGPPRRKTGLSIRQVAEGSWELVHPPCVEERSDDYHEAMEVWKAGEEVEEARDMLRYALEGCPDNVWIHVALGQMALEVDRNVELAQGHFGYAFELVRAALPQPFRGRLSGEVRANAPFYQALDGLIACARQKGDQGQVQELQNLQKTFRG